MTNMVPALVLMVAIVYGNILGSVLRQSSGRALLPIIVIQYFVFWLGASAALKLTDFPIFEATWMGAMYSAGATLIAVVGYWEYRRNEEKVRRKAIEPSDSNDGFVVRKGYLVGADITVPAGLSEQEAEILVERARFEAFQDSSANARFVTRIALTFLGIAIVMGIVAALVAPLLAGGLVLHVLLSGTVVGICGGLTVLFINRYRAKMISAKIRELCHSADRS